MSAETLVSCAVIFAGAALMLASLVRERDVTNALVYVPESRRKKLTLYLAGHRGLMGFFFVGYLAVAAAFAAGHRQFSEAFVGVIFLAGAVFVYVGIAVQSRLLAEMRRTIQGILPICAQCKKIRTPDGKSADPKEWKQLEAYFSERADVKFSHGYCPDCYRKEMRLLDIAAAEGNLPE